MKKNLLLAAAMLLCVSGLRAAGITLYGATTGIDELTEKYRTNVGGIVKFGAEAPLTQTPVFDDVNTGHLSGINSNTVANFGNNKIYVYRWVDAQGSLASVKYYVYSLDDDGNWTHDCNKDLTLNTSYDAFPNAMTYNPQSNIMYGFRNGMDPGGSTIYTIDPETGRMSKKTVAQTYLSSLTTTPLGLTYATDYEGNFYSVDMESGMLDYKGATGVPCDNIMQGWYDAATQTFFLYAAQTNSSQTLYTVNLETGAATKVGDFDGSCAFMKCIFSLSELENQDFPDICSELTVTPTQNGSLSTTLSARAPKYTYDKTTELRGNVTLKFFVDNDNLPVETFKDVSPSETVSTPYTFTSVGTHRISVVAENEKGEGAMLSTTRWIGFDTPCAPSDLLLDIDKNGNWTASWQAPTTGINGGDIDSANLKYEFCINPDGTKQTLSNTTVSGTFEAPQYTGYWFEVKADAGGLTSESILSKQAGFGKPFDAPIYMDFATQAKWALHSPEVMSGSGEWINLKIFEDQEAWAICDNRYADRNDKDLPPATENADAWLLTPPINMHAGVKYTITAIATSLTETGGNISFYEGEDGAQLNNYKHIYTDKDIVFVLDGLMQLDYEYTATTEHVGRFAFRCNSIPGNMTCIINYQIEATESANAPAAVENLKVTAGEKGALNTTISFDVPSKTIGGNTLSNVENVKIFRDKTELVASLYDIVPGQKDVNIIDNNPKQGEHTYTIQVFNEFAGGLRSEATLWVGEDTPVAPQNFNVEENDTEYILTWDTPDAGMHNAYIDFDKITYTVSFEYDPMENSAVYQSGIKENTISIPKEFFEEQLSDRQTLLTFYVSGQTSAGAGKATWYDYLYGKAYDLPFKESCPDSYLQTEPWTIETDFEYQGGWSRVWDGGDTHIADVYSQDGDGGMNLFVNKSSGYYSERLISPKLNTGSNQTPTLHFWLYNTAAASYDAEIQIEARIADRFDEVYYPIKINDQINNSNGRWELYEVPLNEITEKIFRISFHAKGNPGDYIYMDNIVVDNNSTLEKVEGEYTNVYVQRGTLFLAANNSAYTVYAADGTEVTSGTVQGMETVNVEAGAYIVRIGDKTYKVLVH